MKVLIVAEGKHEWSGALVNLVKRLGGQNTAFDQARVADKKIHALHGKGQGYSKKALRWVLEAQKRGFDAIIFLIDEDGNRERTRQIQEAQENDRISQLPRAMGVAVKTFDAWMLADEKALSEVIGSLVQRQPEPESISDPKQVCQDLLSRSVRKMSQSEMYSELSNRIDLEILSNRCKIGFRPFSINIQTLFDRS
jgi:hypothetical protein